MSVVIFRAMNSGYYEVNPASGIDTAVASLRYRLEVVGELVADLAPLATCCEQGVALLHFALIRHLR